MWSVPSRRSEPSTASRMCSGRLSTPSIAPLLAELEAELRRDDHAVARALERLERAREQLLVRERAVRLGRVEEGAAELDGAMDRGDGLALVALFGGAVRRAHAHEAESEGGDGESAGAEGARGEHSHFL